MKKKLRDNWALGFLGLMSFVAIPQYSVAGWIGLSWLLWTVWFLYFIPIKKN